MLETAYMKEEQRRGLLDCGKLADDRRRCNWSRRCCFLLILLVTAAFLIVYDEDIMDVTGDWNPKRWIQYSRNSTLQLLFSVNSQSPNMTVMPIMTNSSIPTPGPTTGFTTGTTSLLPQQTGTPPPYVSPGPYIVEYPHQYRFIVNEPQTCEEHKPYLVLMVPVAPNNRAHRDVIRSTWGGEGLVLDKVVKLFFLLGLYTGEGAEELREQLLQESKEHRDLIQSDFVDCYKNLTIKTMVMLEWLDAYCSGATYAMKIDSDMFLNLPNLVHMLLEAPKTNYMTGLVARAGAVLRDPSSKWYVPVELYPPSTYPRYALGLGYVMSLDLPKKLVEAAKHVTAIYIEDVYLGLCMQHLAIDPTDPPSGNYFHVFPVTYSRCAFSKLVATTTDEKADRVWMWTDFKKPGPYC